MRRVVIAGKIHPSGLRLFDTRNDIDVDCISGERASSLEPHVLEADALLLRAHPFRRELINRCLNIKIVSRHGVGYDAVDVDALSERGVPLTIVGNVNATSVAEHAMMLILAAGKRLKRYDEAVRKGNWKQQDTLEAGEIYGKTLLIIGLGRIGRYLAGLADAFGMRVIAYDPFLTDEQIEATKVKLEPDLLNALVTADYVSLHLPKTDSPILGRDEFAAMKTSSVIINTARGGVVDENALVDALESGSVAAAGLDVFETEPPTKSRLLLLDQVICTPHSAGLTGESAERMAIRASQNIIDFFDGTLDPSFVVNSEQI